MSREWVENKSRMGREWVENGSRVPDASKARRRLLPGGLEKQPQRGIPFGLLSPIYRHRAVQGDFKSAHTIFLTIPVWHTPQAHCSKIHQLAFVVLPAPCCLVKIPLAAILVDIPAQPGSQSSVGSAIVVRHRGTSVIVGCHHAIYARGIII